MKFSIVIPNYNGSHLLKENLPKVIKAAEDAEIIVVDDASTDDSLKTLASFPAVRVVRHRTNQRFAKACNSGVAAARGELVVLLNSDVAPQQNFLEFLSKHFENKKIFAVGCMEIVGKKKRGKSTGRFEQGLLVHNQAKDMGAGPTLWAFGGSAAFDRGKWLMLGGMDPLFRPAYWEDIDLSYRAWKRGWEVRFEPASIVYHEPESTNLVAFGSLRMKIISTRNQILFVWKNIHSRTLIAKHLIWLTKHSASALLRGDITFLKGIGGALLRLPETLKKRDEEKTNTTVSDEAVLRQFENE